jgi:hypothetical protein
MSENAFRAGFETPEQVNYLLLIGEHQFLLEIFGMGLGTMAGSIHAHDHAPLVFPAGPGFF